MPRFKYSVETDANWTEHLYHGDVEVVGGYAETDDPLSIESLLYRGFSLVEDVVETVTEVAESAVEAVVDAAEAVVDAVEDVVEAVDAE